MAGLSGLFAFRARGRPAAPASNPPASPDPPHASKPALGERCSPGDEPDLHALAAHLPDGAPCSDDVLAGLEALLAMRRRRTGILDGPASPVVSDLRVRREGLPDWWAAGENLLLAAPGAKLPNLIVHPFLGAATHAVIVLGTNVTFDHVNLGLAGAVTVLGDEVSCRHGAMSCIGLSTVLIGEKTTATNWAQLDCRNDGIILVGGDGMWAHGVGFLTDDTHAIRDMHTGRRLNIFGGTIVVGRHVWLGESVRVMGGARIGDDSVVGLNSLVKGTAIPPNCVGAGVPARPVRTGVTWSRVDAP